MYTYNTEKKLAECFCYELPRLLLQSQQLHLVSDQCSCAVWHACSCGQTIGTKQSDDKQFECAQVLNTASTEPESVRKVCHSVVANPVLNRAVPEVPPDSNHTSLGASANSLAKEKSNLKPQPTNDRHFQGQTLPAPRTRDPTCFTAYTCSK